MICKGDRTVIENAIKALDNGDEWQHEANTYTKDGEEIAVISRWTLVRGESGKPDYFLIVNTDISELKNTERLLMRAQRLESIGTLAGGIAHDLNNVLSPILMATDMLDTDLDLPESSQPWLAIIRENTERGADLIKQVLTFARGGEEGNQEQVQVSYVMKELVSVWRKTFPQDIKIEYNIKPHLPLVFAEATQIHQVLMNLAVNAKDAMKEAGGVLRITAETADIDQGYSQMNPNAKPGRYVLISVEDSGIGMSPETLERIWDPFFTTKDINKGTGLGLSLSYEFLAKNDGHLKYDNTYANTKFSITLPLRSEENIRITQ